MSEGIVDWGLAERTAAAMIGLSRGGERTYTAAEVERVAAESIETAAAYAGLGAPASPPVGELVDPAP